MKRRTLLNRKLARLFFQNAQLQISTFRTATLTLLDSRRHCFCEVWTLARDPHWFPQRKVYRKTRWLIY